MEQCWFLRDNRQLVSKALQLNITNVNTCAHTHTHEQRQQQQQQQKNEEDSFFQEDETKEQTINEDISFVDLDHSVQKLKKSRFTGSSSTNDTNLLFRFDDKTDIFHNQWQFTIKRTNNNKDLNENDTHTLISESRNKRPIASGNIFKHNFAITRPRFIIYRSVTRLSFRVKIAILFNPFHGLELHKNRKQILNKTMK